MTTATVNPLVDRLREYVASFDHRSTYPTVALTGMELCREAADEIVELQERLGSASVAGKDHHIPLKKREGEVDRIHQKPGLEKEYEREVSTKANRETR